MVLLWRNAAQGVRVVRLTQTEEVSALVGLFEAVAAAEHWQPGDALRKWTDRSVYFGAEVRGRIAGGLQLVLPDASGALPCRSVWPEVSTSDGGRTAHVAVLALDESARGQGMIFWNVVVEMWRHCVGRRIETLYIEVTPRVLPLYRRLGWPLQIRGELRTHWGEGCYLCTLDVAEVAQGLLRRADRSPYYRQIISQAFRVTMPNNASRAASSQAAAWC